MKVPKKGTLTAGVLVGTLLVASGLSVSSYRREIRAVRERIDRLGSQILETECGTVEYARVGSGYPVLVIHGNPGG